MKSALLMQTDRYRRPWLEELARGLVQTGTDARRLLEADFDGWSYTDSLDESIGPARLQARIRSLFTGLAGGALTNPALNGSFLARGRHWR